mgnify:CR=1 FL=1
MKLPMEALYRLQKWIWRKFRPRTNGVKVLLFDVRGRLVLIRNTYGRSDLFVLPGGGVRPFEKAAHAAVREVREELGCGVRNVAFVATYSSRAEGKRDTVHLFQAQIDGEPSIGRREVQEAAFFALDDLPVSTSPATRRRIEEYVGSRQRDSQW